MYNNTAIEGGSLVYADADSSAPAIDGILDTVARGAQPGPCVIRLPKDIDIYKEVSHAV